MASELAACIWRCRPQLLSMNDTSTTPAATSLTVVYMLAALLERLEASRMPVDAAQHQLVAARLAQALADVPSGPQLTAILETHPAAAEVYENTHYHHAGLCRSPLDAALAAELGASAAIAQARQRPTEGTTHGKN